MTYSSNWTVFASNINTLIVSTLYSSSGSEATCWRKLEKYSLVFLFERAVSFNKLSKGVDKMPSIAKKRLLRKKFKKHMLTSVQRSILVQTTGSVFVETVESVRRETKFELELVKIVDCFLDGYGGYESNLASFKIKHSNKYFF